jgi:hypothetical protein
VKVTTISTLSPIKIAWPNKGKIVCVSRPSSNPTTTLCQRVAKLTFGRDVVSSPDGPSRHWRATQQLIAFEAKRTSPHVEQFVEWRMDDDPQMH